MFGVYAFSEVALSSESISVIVELSSVTATTEIGDVTLLLGANVPIDVAAATVVVEIGDITLSISSYFTVSGVIAVTELGQVLVYGIEENEDDSNYSPLNPSEQSNYSNLTPNPGSTWNDLVT